MTNELVRGMRSVGFRASQSLMDEVRQRAAYECIPSMVLIRKAILHALADGTGIAETSAGEQAAVALEKEVARLTFYCANLADAIARTQGIGLDKAVPQAQAMADRWFD